MLGHIFENLLEDNKDKGAFYTPKEIVHYMCQETLTEYCLNHDFSDYGITMIEEDKRAIVEKLVKHKELDEELFKRACKSNQSFATWLRRMDEHIDRVKICDPAIGSGAFPMGLLQEIVDIKEHIHYHLSNINQGNQENPANHGLDNWKPAEVKENIIQNSIYGVDIEKGAVDIARLRFWLSLVVDEIEPKPLPNLDYKIVVGNSLVSKFEDEIIEIDWSTDTTSVGMFGQANREKTIQLLKKISGKQHEYFHADNKDKNNLRLQIRNLKIDLLINQLDQMIKTKGLENKPTGNGKKIKEQTELYLKTEGWKKNIKSLESLKKDPNKKFVHFDWKLDFPEVLNPILVEQSQESKEIEVLNKQITALNAEIDAINVHLEESQQDLRILRLQLTVANKQVNITKAQLDEIENRIDELKGTITKVEKNIASEPADITYRISSINKEIENINKRIRQINPVTSGSGKLGFDIVIGNPPYIQLQKIKKISDELFNQKFESFERTGDIYSLFYEKGFSILKKNGLLTFITSNKWMRTNYGKSTRKFFTVNTNPILVIDFGNIQIFENATVDTNILMLKNNPSKDQTIKACRFTEKYDKKTPFSIYIQQNLRAIEFNDEDAWVISDNDKSLLIEKIRNQGIPLHKWNIIINYGIKTGLNNAFVINEETKNRLIKKDPSSIVLLKPLLRGKDIQKWLPNYNKLWLISTFPSKKLNIDEFPAVKKWFSDFGKEKLIQDGTGRKKTSNDWFETQDQIAYWMDFEKPKIIYPNMTKYLPFVYDEDDHYYHNDKSFHIVGDSLKWLVSLLNSLLFKFAFSDCFPELQGGTRELRKVFFDKIPIKRIPEIEQKPFNKLVDQILSLKKQGEDTTDLERQIDVMVFKLYELTYEEVLVVEPEFWLSREEYDNY